MLPVLRVLLADADAAARHALALLLRSKLGLHVVGEAVEGAGLAQALVETEPDLLLLDWTLPGRPDRDRLLALRAAWPQLQWVILSVDAAHAIEAAALNAVFIHKGSAAKQVLEQLQRLVEDRVAGHATIGGAPSAGAGRDD